MKRLFKFLPLILLIGILLAWPAGTQAQDTGPQALVLTYDGPVTAVMIEYMERGSRQQKSGGLKS